MPQGFSGGFGTDNNPMNRMYPHINSNDPKYEQDHRFRDAATLLDRLALAGSKYRVHYLPGTNPFGQHYNEADITAAVNDCNQKIPVRADYGDAIKGVIPNVVRDCYHAGYAINSPEVVDAMYSVAVQLCSIDYQTQLGQRQANYGTLDSSKTKVPYSPGKG